MALESIAESIVRSPGLSLSLGHAARGRTVFGDQGTEARFVGCHSSKAAIAFAGKVLRGDAVAWGTSEYTYPAPGGNGASFVRFLESTDIVTARLAWNPDEFENQMPWLKCIGGRA